MKVEALMSSYRKRAFFVPFIFQLRSSEHRARVLIPNPVNATPFPVIRDNGDEPLKRCSVGDSNPWDEKYRTRVQESTSRSASPCHLVNHAIACSCVMPFLDSWLVVLEPYRVVTISVLRALELRKLEFYRVSQQLPA
jgi:hypothetical protein